jgi:hypothetical protein
MSIVTGRLFLHSDMGTDGSYFVMQRSEHISYEKDEYGVTNNTNVYEPNELSRAGRVVAAKRPDGRDFTSRGAGDVTLLDIVWKDGEAETARRSDTVVVERWTWDGLFYLKSGDKLTIFEQSLGSIALWDGEVCLEKKEPYRSDDYWAEGETGNQKPCNTYPVTAVQWRQWFIEKRWASLQRPN